MMVTVSAMFNLSYLSLATIIIVHNFVCKVVILAQDFRPEEFSKLLNQGRRHN